MSTYQVNKICRLVLHDKTFRAKVIAEPELAVSSFKLTDQERKALLAGDVAKLYQTGASGFLLQILGRYEVFGLDLLKYNERLLSIDS